MVVVLALALLVAVAVASWAMLRGPGRAAPAAAVDVLPAVGVRALSSQGISQSFEFVGRVRAIEKVELRARVEGFLEKVLFRDGQDIKAGDVVYQIEKIQFQAALDQARANLAAAEAVAENAKVEHQRAIDLSKQNFASVARLDQTAAALSTAKGRVLQLKAAQVQAEVKLDYTDIRAPIDGRIGSTAYTVGNLVNPASGVLVTIVRQDPVYVQFPVSVRNLETIREARHRDGGLSKIEVRIRLSTGLGYPESGVWDFTDPQVNQQTDSVMMRAVVPNPERKLIDGQFVTAVIQERQQEAKLVVPAAALQVDQSGYYALVVDAQHQVVQRRVQVGAKHDAGMIVLSGLREGEQVIVEGIQKVRPGQTVRAKVLPMPGVR